MYKESVVRLSTWRSSTVAEIESVPNVTWNEGAVVKLNRLRIVPVDLHAIGFPTVRSAPVEIYVAYLVRARPIYLKCVGRTSFKCSGRWIVQPRGIDLVIHSYLGKVIICRELRASETSNSKDKTKSPEKKQNECRNFFSNHEYKLRLLLWTPENA